MKKYLKEIGIKPRRMAVYEQAFSHRSHTHETGGAPHESNERLEFLGDSVLGLALAEYLLTRYATSKEGDLSKMKAQLGSRQTLAEVAQRLKLTDHLRLGRGEEIAGSRSLPSLTSNTFEALVGALYIDRGYEPASKFVIQQLGPEFEKDLVSKDYKSLLQEFAQRRFRTPPIYQVARAYGPEHNKTFEILMRIHGKVYGRGRGRTKKDAEQEAAKQALRRFGGDGRHHSQHHPQPSEQNQYEEGHSAQGDTVKRRWFWPFRSRAA